MLDRAGLTRRLRSLSPGVEGTLVSLSVAPRSMCLLCRLWFLRCRSGSSVAYHGFLAVAGWVLTVCPCHSVACERVLGFLPVCGPVGIISSSCIAPAVVRSCALAFPNGPLSPAIDCERVLSAVASWTPSCSIGWLSLIVAYSCFSCFGCDAYPRHCLGATSALYL